MLSSEENEVINNILRDMDALKLIILDNDVIDSLNETIDIIQKYRDENENK